MTGDTQDDPRTWSQAHIDAFARDAEPAEVARVLLALLGWRDDAALTVLAGFLRAKHANTYMTGLPSALATRAIVRLGPPGVSLLMKQLAKREVRYASDSLSVLWNVARGRGVPVYKMMHERVEHLSTTTLPPGTTEAALQAVRVLFQDARTDRNTFSFVLDFLRAQNDEQRESKTSASDRAALMELLGEGAVRLSRAVLDEFALLIGEEHVEERYQDFLTKHPALIDPLAAEVVPKQRLGIEYATDFAVRSHDDRWVLVEIERPHDDLFTTRGDFRERFTHAFGQVLDFQTWVDENVAYARNHMKLISAPRGLLVMGLRARLDAYQQAKLRRFADNSRRIDVVTFDDLHARGRSLYENIIHRADAMSLRGILS